MLLNANESFCGGHDIRQIWNIVKKRMISFESDEDQRKQFKEMTKELDDYILELYDKIDKDHNANAKMKNMDFSRCPFNTDDEYHFYIENYGNEVVDLEMFVEVFKKIDYNLNCIAGYYEESKGLIAYGKNKYFDRSSRRLINNCFVYDAIKISLSFVDDNVIMNLLPTVHVLKSDESQLDRFSYQSIVNNEISKLYNKQMNEKIDIWIRKLSNNRKLIFELGNAILEFSTQRIRFAGTGSIDKCYQAKETELAFDYENDSCIAVNQLKGLINYGPLESYANRSVRLAVLSPRECAADIWRHLNELNKHHATTLKQDKAFLPEYIGFQDVFRCGLNIPNGNDNKRTCRCG